MQKQNYTEQIRGKLEYDRKQELNERRYKSEQKHIEIRKVIV